MGKENLGQKRDLPDGNDKDIKKAVLSSDSESSHLPPKKISIRPRGIDAETELDAEPVEERPRLRHTGTLKTPEHQAGKKRRRRRGSEEEKPGEFPNHLPGAKRQIARRRRFLLVIALLVLVFAAANYYTGKFFYASGLSEGIQRGLDARNAVKEAVTATRSNDKVFAALLNLRSSKPDRQTTEMLTLLVLQSLRETPAESLPSFLRQGHNTIEDFAAAYVAMRLKDFSKASAILRETEPTLPPDLFKYLMNDPSMREFATEPRVMGFY